MYSNVLVPMALDHDVSPKTLAVARHLAGDGGSVVALHVYEAPQGSVASYLSEEAVRESPALLIPETKARLTCWVG